MKNKKRRLKIGILAYIAIFAGLLSCTDILLHDGESISISRKSKDKNEQLTVAVAKEWFEDKFEPIVATRSASGKEHLLKPTWDKAKEHNRMRYEVVEIPILTRGMHITVDYETSQKWKPGNKTDFVRNTVKLVVLKDKQTGKTRSFIMKFIGSFDYLKNTRTMGRNGYLYREPDFDGAVMFYEINGTFINGWKYVRGRIVATISPSLGETSQKSDPSTRSIVEECEDVTYTEFVEKCYDSYYSVETEYGVDDYVDTYCDLSTEYVTTQQCTWYDDESGWDDDRPSGGVKDNDPPQKEPEQISRTPKELMKKSNFVPWTKDANCLDLAQQVLSKYGLTNFGSRTNAFRLVYQTEEGLKNWGNNFAQNYKNAIDCIDIHLNENRVIIVGVDYVKGTANEGTTDHFVVITGRGYDSDAHLYYYTFMDSGTSSQENGCSNLNRLYYDDKNYNFSGYSQAIGAGDFLYTVSQVRPNDGKSYKTEYIPNKQ